MNPKERAIEYITKKGYNPFEIELNKAIDIAIKETAKQIFEDLDNKEFGTYEEVKRNWCK